MNKYTDIPAENYLNSKQVAEFVTNGLLEFPELIEKDLCEEIFQEFESNEKAKHWYPQAQPLYSVWPEGHPIQKLVNDVRIRGIIESLMGPNPQYDHHFPHKTVGGKAFQRLHQDAAYDTRMEAFDIQVSFFPRDCPMEIGGTRFLPGSHFRKVWEGAVGRYQHIRGMKQAVCKAGTFVVWHHNLWHGAQANKTDDVRYMFKIRINPTVKQQRTWNTEDIDDPTINGILNKNHHWHGGEHRTELFNRIRLWRHMTGNQDFDLGFYEGRIACEPQNLEHWQLK